MRIRSDAPPCLYIVNEKNWDRLSNLIDPKKVVLGGLDESNRTERYIAPTLIDDVDWNDGIMEEEIFGPILPIVYYDDLDEAISLVEERESSSGSLYLL